MVSLLAIHAREEHIVVVFIFLPMASDFISIRIRRIVLDHLCIDWSALCYLCRTVLVAHDIRSKCLSKEQWALAILLAVQIFGERENLIRRILVHWQLCR